MNDQETHVKFLKNLDKSQTAVAFVARVLDKSGWYDDVRILSYRKAPTRNQWQQYSDQGDIQVAYMGDVMRVEVKENSAHFTGRKDYPFKNIIVDENYKIEKPDSLPLIGYYIANKQHTCIIEIPVSTKEYWFNKKAKDSVWGKLKNFVWISKYVEGIKFLIIGKDDEIERIE